MILLILNLLALLVACGGVVNALRRRAKAYIAALWFSYLGYFAIHGIIAYAGQQWLNPGHPLWTLAYLIGTATALWFFGGIPMDLLFVGYFIKPGDMPTEGSRWYRAGYGSAILLNTVAKGVAMAFRRLTLFALLTGMFFQFIPTYNSFTALFGFAVALLVYLITGPTTNWERWRTVGIWGMAIHVGIMLLVTTVPPVRTFVQSVSKPVADYYGDMASGETEKLTANAYFTAKYVTAAKVCSGYRLTAGRVTCTGYGAPVEVEQGTAFVPVERSSPKRMLMDGLYWLPVYVQRTSEPSKDGFDQGTVYLVPMEHLDRTTSLPAHKVYDRTSLFETVRYEYLPQSTFGWVGGTLLVLLILGLIGAFAGEAERPRPTPAAAPAAAHEPATGHGAGGAHH